MNLVQAKEIISRGIVNKVTKLDLSSFSSEKKLSSADLLELMPDILRLDHLTWINLSSNQITDIEVLEDLKNLTSLDLSDNKISNVSVISKFKNLKKLDLSNNRIKALTFIHELELLNTLIIRGNEISNISFIKEAKSLNKLDISNNLLTEAFHLGRLSALTWLDISNNQITDISFVSDLKLLLWLKFYENPYINLPANMLNKYYFGSNEIQSIVKYYEQLKSAGVDYIYEAKVLIVGEPRAGKTTLFRKLQNPEYLPQEASVEEKESTIGIEIKLWTFRYDEEKDYRAYLWDFGGQEKQYALHQYFFTERSLYILLANNQNKIENFNYWFEIIATFGEGCPVLVVLNEINKKVINFDASIYRREFDKRIVEIEERSVNFADNSDGRYYNLSNEIKTKLRNLNHIGQPLPSTWVKVRQKLSDITEPIINIDQYNKICEECGVDRNDYKKQILEYLNDLGIALNYKNDDNLRTKVILKPNWVIDALYVVLKAENIIEANGKFTVEDVFNLWSNYTIEEKSTLLLLMQKRKFEIAYKLENEKLYIVPMLLSDTEPIYEFDETNNLVVHFDYDFKPKGIISRLIVRYHKEIVSQQNKQIVWKTGVLLKHKNSFAKITESEDEKKIVITINGSNSVTNREHMTIMRSQIKLIHRDWFENRLKFVEKIPCICEVCKFDESPYFYNLEEVENSYEINIELTCKKSLRMKNIQKINPRRLLEGIYKEEVKRENMQIEQNRIEIANMNITVGNNNLSIQDVKDSKIHIGEIVNYLSAKTNNSQNPEMEELAEQIIRKLETNQKLKGIGAAEIQKAKEAKWETKFKLAIPLMGLEFSKNITPEEFADKVRDWLYGGDLQTNLLD